MTRTLSWWQRLHGDAEVASCREASRALQAYLDGQVDDVTARRVARHLQTCRRCGLDAATYLAIRAALVRRGHDVDPDAVARLRRFAQSLPDREPSDES